MPTRKIMLVDDSSTALTLERMILHALPYEVVCATDGVEAVALAEREKPDLIIMDVRMPRMDGFEACRRIRAHPGMGTVPIILVISRGEFAHFDVGFESGCTDYLTKPFSGLDLVAKLSAHLGV